MEDKFYRLSPEESDMLFGDLGEMMGKLGEATMEITRKIAIDEKTLKAIKEAKEDKILAGNVLGRAEALSSKISEDIAEHKKFMLERENLHISINKKMERSLKRRETELDAKEERSIQDYEGMLKTATKNALKDVNTSGLESAIIDSIEKIEGDYRRFPGFQGIGERAQSVIAVTKKSIAMFKEEKESMRKEIGSGMDELKSANREFRQLLKESKEDRSLERNKNNTFFIIVGAAVLFGMGLYGSKFQFFQSLLG